jgi:hypothetical protein
MTAIDTNTTSMPAPTTDNFWSELRYRIVRAASMTPVEASRMMRQFLDSHDDCWPQIRADIETNANLRALRERAFEIRDAPRGRSVTDLKEVDKLMLELVCTGLSDWETATIDLAKHGLIERSSDGISEKMDGRASWDGDGTLTQFSSGLVVGFDRSRPAHRCSPAQARDDARPRRSVGCGILRRRGVAGCPAVHRRIRTIAGRRRPRERRLPAADHHQRREKGHQTAKSAAARSLEYVGGKRPRHHVWPGKELRRLRRGRRTQLGSLAATTCRGLRFHEHLDGTLPHMR